jgi:putative transposase
LLGPGGLRPQVTKAVLERALAEEMTGHLGYETHDPAVRGSGNSRNCTTPKTALTDVGAVDLAVPRDRDGTACESPWSGGGRARSCCQAGRRGEPADV